jgi:exodeoxyribonuclease V alpha subunit
MVSPRDQAEVLEGVLERVSYASEESGWSVVRLHVPGRRDAVTAVGSLPGVQPGETLRLTGRFIIDKRYGEQFKVESCLSVQPSTLAGMEKYLGSGLVRGIGRVMAKRLVERFGFETFEVIEARSERLTEVEGIGPKRRAGIVAAWAEQRAVKEVMLFLQAHGVSPAFAVRIYRTYGERAIATVRENPYQLAVDVFGIGFKTADRIAGELGIAKSSPRRAEAGVLHVLGELADEGHLYCPRAELVERAVAILELAAEAIEAALTALAAAEQVVIEGLEPGEPVYLKSLHVSERGAAERLGALCAVPAAPIAVDHERALAWLAETLGLELAPAQREAIRRAIESKLLIVTGGPGTGKTTIVNGIIRVLEKKGRRILLCAPTGRAARRLAETTGREARTIHRLLEFNPRGMFFERNQERPLETDLLVCDETSMVDAVLFYNLLKAVPPAAQLVLVGDIDQLPSVGPGNVLRDLIASGVADVVTLITIFRQAQRSLIVRNAHRINRGEELELEPQEGVDADFFFVARTSPEEVLAAIKKTVAERIPARFGLDPREEVQVLTPMHRGLLGSLQLNAELQALLNPEGETLVRGSRLFRAGDKVMQLRNNYELEVFNGDLGRIQAIDVEERTVEVRFDERVVRYDAAELDELVLGYACSIHKSQGSEYPAVVIPLHTQHFPMLQRNLLYTAVTRGRKLVVVIGNRRAISLALANQSVGARSTRLAERLREAAARSWGQQPTG